MEKKTPAPKRAGIPSIEEWLRLMTELASADRDAYRVVRAYAWELVAASHQRKTLEEKEEWEAAAS